VLYYSKGYPFAQVAPVISDAAGTAGDTIEVKFFVFEGEQVDGGFSEFHRNDAAREETQGTPAP